MRYKQFCNQICVPCLLHMVSRVELKNDLMYYKLADIVKFPRHNPTSIAKTPIHTLPSNAEISSIINRASQDAVQCASEFGMSCSESDLRECRLVSRLQRQRVDSEEDTSQTDWFEMGFDLEERESLDEPEESIVNIDPTV